MYSTTSRIHRAPSAYAERHWPRETRIEQLCTRVIGPAVRQRRIGRLQLRRFVPQVAAHSHTMHRLGDDAVQAMLPELRARLRREGFSRQAVAQAFALIREVAGRTINMRHFDVQLQGGWVLLHGLVAEMDTGEGKTLTATLPACTAALAGVPVHIVTVNDYLARRDADAMAPLYRACGLTVGVITGGMQPQERRQAYACDITYCTNKEVVFDYLKDRLVLGRKTDRMHLQLECISHGTSARLHQLLLRGLHFAIVDEADSVLIDEARTPLLISSGGDDTVAHHVYQTALQLAAQLESPEGFTINDREHTVALTTAGRQRLTELATAHDGVWQSRPQREELVRQALTAQHLMQRDRHYLVKDGTVQIIDEYTGRLMPDRTWEHGLHQLIETKEGCALTGCHAPLARLSYQRFFRRYLRLAGMTGTAREVRGELWSVYRLAAVAIPTNRPRQRSQTGEQVFATAEAKWHAVVARVSTLHRQGRPILLGTRSVAASEFLSRLLTAAHLPHQVLNARQDREEATIIAQAGEPGRITVATNMAGRGTDIRLAPGMAARGGLHVIATERHEARRIDRQLFGRCARQGDLGSYEIFVSLDDEVVTVHAGRPWQWLSALVLHRWQRLGWWLGRYTVWRAQRHAEHLHAQMRQDLLTLDEHLETALAFSGRPE